MIAYYYDLDLVRNCQIWWINSKRLKERYKHFQINATRYDWCNSLTIYVEKNRPVHEIEVFIVSARREGSDESAYAQTRQSLHWSYTQSMGVDEVSDQN